uniref:Uncharacterized protein n=1 Tax=Rhizophora mucronata TaxID=61149 RepID=A0A2P2LK34_RHIMU
MENGSNSQFFIEQRFLQRQLLKDKKTSNG